MCGTSRKAYKNKTSSRQFSEIFYLLSCLELRGFQDNLGSPVVGRRIYKVEGAWVSLSLSLWKVTGGPSEMPIFYFMWMRNKLLLCLGLCIWGFTYLVVKSFYNSWTFGSLLKLQLLLKLHQIYNMGGIIYWASPVAQMVKNLPAMWETWVGKIPWRRAWQPTPVFPMDRGAWQATVHGVAKSQTWLND